MAGRPKSNRVRVSVSLSEGVNARLVEERWNARIDDVSELVEKALDAYLPKLDGADAADSDPKPAVKGK